MVCINIFLYFQKVFESFLLMNKSFITQWAYFINLRSGIKVRVFEMLYKIFTTLLTFLKLSKMEIRTVILVVIKICVIFCNFSFNVNMYFSVLKDCKLS